MGLTRYGPSLCVLEPHRAKVKRVDVSVKSPNPVVLSHVILNPLRQKQSLCTVKGGLVSTLVHYVFHLGMNDWSNYTLG